MIVQILSNGDYVREVMSISPKPNCHHELVVPRLEKAQLGNAVLQSYVGMADALSRLLPWLMSKDTQTYRISILYDR